METQRPKKEWNRPQNTQEYHKTEYNLRENAWADTAQVGIKK